MNLKTILLAGLALAPFALPAAARAADDPNAAPAPAEIVVTGKFVATGAGSATKLNIPVLDTPFSVEAYTGSFMTAIQTLQVSDLYKYMTGVQRAGNTAYDMTLRGFKTSINDRNSIMTDGLPGQTVRFGSPPTVGTDHIEVVLGPASILYGQAQPGGFVNIVTKKPQANNQTEVELTANRNVGFDGRGTGTVGSVDSTGALNADRTFLYRLIAEVGYTTNFRDFSYERPTYIAPSLTWRITPSTNLTYQYEYRSTRTHYDLYLVAPKNNVANAAPFNTTYQEPGDFQSEVGRTSTITLNHNFTSAIKLNGTFRKVDHKDTQDNFDTVGILADNATVSRRARGQVNYRTYNFGDVNLTDTFNLGSVENRLIVGFQGGRETANLDRTQFFNGATTGTTNNMNVSVLNPIHGLVGPLSSYPAVNPATPANLNDRYTIDDSTGVYASDLITLLPQLKAMVGFRSASEKVSIAELHLPNVASQFASSKSTLPQGGIIFEPTKQWSFYTSYSTSFVPVAPSNQDINGKYTFSPTTANSLEFGIKADLFEHRLTASLSDFDIKMRNALNTFACPLGTCASQIGAQESKGIEADLNARPLPGWQIIAGYAHTDAKVTASNIVQQIGARVTNSAKDSAHLWSRYDWTDGPLKNAGFGVGVTYTGDRTGLLPTATVPDVMDMPAYALVDLGVYYTIAGTDITFKISNLLDKRYYESAGLTANIQLLPGATRLATLSVRRKF